MFFRSKKHNIKESSLNVSMCPMEAWTDCLIRPCRKGQETYAKQKYWYRVIQTRSYRVGRDRRQQGPLQAIKSMCWVSQKWFMGGTLNPCRYSLSWQWLKCEEMIEHTNKRQSRTFMIKYSNSLDRKAERYTIGNLAYVPFLQRAAQSLT